MTRASRLAGAPRERIAHGWQVCATAPGALSSPDPLAGGPALDWVDAAEPGTAAAVLRAHGRWSLDGPARRFDAEDWWYRVDFSAPRGEGTLWLGFDGLAGVADAWLNGELLARSSNMFVASEHDITRRVQAGANTLVLRFQALDTALAQRRPRPRWRAPMVEHQQMRWQRQTLLGRTPGWSPPAAAVGPWKDIWLERRDGSPLLSGLRLHAGLTDEGSGCLDMACELQLPAGQRLADVELELSHAGRVHRTLLIADGARRFSARLQLPQPALWWPHTHGTPALYAARLDLRFEGDSPPIAIDLAPVGFRHIELDTSDSGFSLRVNGVPVFCRGACWMPLDVVTLRASPDATRAAVEQARDAGMNMLRVPGTGVYEDAAFFDACDTLGVLVWQEFMFANMDYPEGDADFLASVRTEVAQQLDAWQGRASLAVLCGNSEVEQQAAMWGAPRELWEPALFHHTLAAWAADALPGVPYWPSSAHGGAFPHQSNAGTSSYYGVGAYLREPSDARRADLRFATECLAFANLPEERTVARMPGGLALRMHHPAWKARVPRDLGAGWDFEDVRDHYLARHYGVDVLKCRYADHDRYLRLGRAVTGELMGAAFDEWRRPGSRTGGALVLFLRDLWAGAGWGLLDDTGLPKPCFYALGRALQPLSVSISDEGGNGLVAHLVNDAAEPLSGQLELTLFGPGDAVVGQSRHPVQLAGRGGLSLPLAAGLENFFDLSYAYRFGPPPVRVVHVRLVDAGGVPRGEAFFLPAGPAPDAPHDIGLVATIEGSEIVIGCQRFAHTVQIEFDSAHVPADNFFHLAAGSQRRVALRGVAGKAAEAIRARVTALNADRSLHLREEA